MDDNFNFGEPGREWSEAKLRPRGPSARPHVPARIVILGVGILLAGVGVFAFMNLMDDAGRSVGDAHATAIGQVGIAQDAQTQLHLKNAAMSAMALAAEDVTGSSYGAASAEALGQLDGSVTFTEGPSTGPGVVSVKAGTTTWAAASMSDSGTCLWLRIDDGQQSFGSGSPCTGEAAMGASDPSW